MDWKSIKWEEMNLIFSSTEEIDTMRINAYLSFDEMGEIPNVDVDIQYYYMNRKGNKIYCKALFVRDNGEVIVINENGCQVMLDKSKLHINKD